MSARHVLIIGGGATGVLLAAHLLRGAEQPLHVTIVEKRSAVGRGLAYGTQNPGHLLNVRAYNMSAFPDEPDHFWDWLQARQKKATEPLPDANDKSCFVPRRVYAEYVASLIEPYRQAADAKRSIEVLHDVCLGLEENDAGVTASLQNHGRLSADVAVLATGHPEPKPQSGCFADPWTPPGDAGIRPDDAVLILGTGLTMVDYIIALQLSGHHGPITAMSRRGLMPHPHRPVKAIVFREDEIPFGQTSSKVMRWMRRRAGEHMAGGGDWRGIVDGIRPFTQKLWQSLKPADRKRFLAHARAWWDVHRHRMPPSAAVRIDAAVQSGQLQVIAAKVSSVEEQAGVAVVSYRRRGQNNIEALRVAKVIPCMTPAALLPEGTNPLLTSLFAAGAIRSDTLELGLEVTPDFRVLSEDGEASPRIYAAGPLTRPALWEIVAIPDIRNQCARLAVTLRERLANKS